LPRKSLLETPLKVDAIQMSTLHRLLHVLLEQSPVRLQLQCSFLVQRVFRVGLQEEVLEPIHYGVDGEDGLPVLPEDVQTDIALQVYVGVVHLRLALDLWWFMRVCCPYLEAECKLAMSIKALQIR